MKPAVLASIITIAVSKAGRLGSNGSGWCAVTRGGGPAPHVIDSSSSGITRATAAVGASLITVRIAGVVTIGVISQKVLGALGHGPASELALTRLEFMT
jgi:hypothetical protein